MNIVTRPIVESDYPAWNDYVLRNPDSGPFHLTAWLQVVRETYGHEPQYLVAEESSRIVGLLPLFLISNPLSRRYLASCPFTSYGGICADNAEASAALYNASRDLALKYAADYVEIKNAGADGEPSADWKIKDSYVTMIMDLREGAQSIWDNWNGKNRSNVRRATRAGVSVDFGPQLLNEFYDVTAMNMRILGTPVHSRRLYERILEHFGSAATVSVARVDGRPIACALAVTIRGKTESLVGASLPEFRNLKATSLLYWDMIQRACRDGLTELDMGRSTWNSGTFKFKRQLGCQPKPLSYAYYLNKSASVPNVSPDNPRYKLAIRTWQRLPLAVTKLLGPRLIRYVA